MALKDHAKGNVLDEYKDENLTKGFGPGRVKQLCRVPQEQRQNVMAEANSRLYTYEFTEDGLSASMGESLTRTVLAEKSTKSFDEVIEEILQENGW